MVSVITSQLMPTHQPFPSHSLGHIPLIMVLGSPRGSFHLGPRIRPSLGKGNRPRHPWTAFLDIRRSPWLIKLHQVTNMASLDLIHNTLLPILRCRDSHPCSTLKLNT